MLIRHPDPRVMPSSPFLAIDVQRDMVGDELKAMIG